MAATYGFCGRVLAGFLVILVFLTFPVFPGLPGPASGEPADNSSGLLLARGCGTWLQTYAFCVRALCNTSRVGNSSPGALAL